MLEVVDGGAVEYATVFVKYRAINRNYVATILERKFDALVSKRAIH